MNFQLNNLEWRCEVCGIVRDDEDISVVTASIDLKSGGSMSRNVKHCVDHGNCVLGARAIVDKWLEKFTELFKEKGLLDDN